MLIHYYNHDVRQFMNCPYPHIVPKLPDRKQSFVGAIHELPYPLYLPYPTLPYLTLPTLPYLTLHNLEPLLVDLSRPQTLHGNGPLAASLNTDPTTPTFVRIKFNDLPALALHHSFPFSQIKC